MKRIFSLLIACFMLASILSMPVAAAEKKSPAKTTVSKAKTKNTKKVSKTTKKSKVTKKSKTKKAKTKKAKTKATKVPAKKTSKSVKPVTRDSNLTPRPAMTKDPSWTPRPVMTKDPSWTPRPVMTKDPSWTPRPVMTPNPRPDTPTLPPYRIIIPLNENIDPNILRTGYIGSVTMKNVDDYGWSYKISDNTVIQLDSSITIRDEASGVLVTRWYFKAIKEGNASITLTPNAPYAYSIDPSITFNIKVNGTDPIPSPTTKPTPAPTPYPGILNLQPGIDNQLISGQLGYIKLEAPVGYTWDCAIADNSIIDFYNTDNLPIPATAIYPPRPATFFSMFKALKEGKTTITLVCKPADAWILSDAPEKVLVFNIVVSQGKVIVEPLPEPVIMNTK